MEIFKHIPKKKYQTQKCEACKKTKMCTWHHIGHRRYSDKWIWLCIFDSKTSGCHERVHEDYNWAYKQGYLIKHNTGYQIMIKNKKTKGCDHSKTYNRFVDGKQKIMCNYCGNEVEQVKYGHHKAKKEQNRDVTKQLKMGQEIQDPRVKEAEKLKRDLKNADIQIKKNLGDEVQESFWVDKKKDIKSRMVSLQRSYE